MRRHAWIVVVAIVGVLLHAAAVVRHHGTMAGVSSAERALLADLAIGCHGAGSPLDDSSQRAPSLPPQDGGSDCPICSGLSAVFVSPTPPASVLLTDVCRQTFSSWTEQIAGSIVRLHSPARRPPVLA